MANNDMPKHESEKQTFLSEETIGTIVSAYAQRPDASVELIVELTRRLTGSTVSSATVSVAPMAEPAKLTPACTLEDAIEQDQVHCLYCGKGFKTLKRHLRSAHNKTEEEYRADFGLAEDFPMVAPSYSERRAEVATEFGFGTYDRATSARAKPDISGAA